MLTPREIVFRLNGGGDFTPLGGVELPVLPLMVPPVAPVVPVMAVVVPLGETSGEKMPPSAYSDRFSPYFFAALRSTSRISTSITISARGLSFCSMIFSMMPTTDGGAADGDRVRGLVAGDRRLHRDAGQPDDRAEDLRQLGGVGVRQVERADHLLVVLRVLGRRVLEDEDRLLAQHLVRELVHRHDLVAAPARA